MNEIMSYQYPPPGTPPPPYDTGYPLPPHSTGMDMRSPGQPGRNGLPAMSFDLKRPGSHPNVKIDPNVKMDPDLTSGLDDMPAMSFDLKRSGYHPNIKMDSDSAPGLDDQTITASGEKKKGKLSYHRASTACTNCRKRKIRCQAGSPNQSKCKTCEHLNKDCKFESVNHQSSVDARHVSLSRTPAGHKLVSASSASSPGMPSVHPVDMHGSQGHGPMSMPPLQQMALADASDLKMTSGSIGRAYPDYGTQGMAPHWMSSEAGTGSSRAKHTSWGSYGHESAPITSGFPQYTHSTPPPHTAGWGGAVGAGDPGPRTDMSWTSYQPGTGQPFSPMSQLGASGGYDRKTPTSSAMGPAEMYPPIPTMTPGSSMDHSSSSLSPPQLPSQAAGYSSWQQQSYPPLPGKSGDGYGGGWYSQSEEGHSLPAPLSHGVATAAYYGQR